MVGMGRQLPYPMIAGKKAMVEDRVVGIYEQNNTNMYN